MDILDLILKAAEQHGKDTGDLDFEVGDLQQLARDLWAMLTPEQRISFHARGGTVIDWNEFIDNWMEDKHGQRQDLHSSGPESGQNDDRSHHQRRPRKPRIQKGQSR